MRKFAAVFLVLCAVPLARAETLPTYSLREATYHADTVVLAEPVELATGQFKVTQVLRGGGGVKAGATVTVSPDECALYSLPELAKVAVKASGEEVPPVPVLEAMLFLAAPVEANKPVRLVLSGVRLVTANGDVLTAHQPHNPGGYAMTARDDLSWPLLVREAKAAADAIDEVFRLRAATGKDRAAGLLKWVERHRLEFGGGFRDGERTGWGSLETDVFYWACERGRPEECWAAVRLYAELNHCAVLPLKRPCFGTPAGRDFLFQIALNERLLDGDRARAVALLSNARTLLPAADPNDPAVAPCSDEDLALLVDKLQPLLSPKSDVLRAAAAEALCVILRLRGTSDPVRMALQNALPALDGAYKAEKPGPRRDLLVETIHGIGGAEHWKELTGNGTGLAVLLKDFGRTNEQVSFWLEVLPATEKLYECPTLVLERLDANQRVVETKTRPLPAATPVRWEDGWSGELLLVQFTREGLQPGEWRVSVRGTVGKDKAKWASESKLFPGPQQPNGPRYKGIREEG
jgi:hypothetical protein